MLNTKYLLPKILFVTLLACGIVLATSVTFSNPLTTEEIRPISRVSVASDGSQAMLGSSEEPEIAVQGRWIAFKSRANNLVENDTNNAIDIFVHDTQSGETTRVSVSSSGEQANERSEYFDISEDGRFIAFESFADNLVVDDDNSSSDIFLHDRETGETVLISVSSSEEWLSFFLL